MLKVASIQKAWFAFQISKKKILSWGWNLNKLFCLLLCTGISNFKFRIVIWSNLFLKIWRFEKRISLSEKKTPLNKPLNGVTYYFSLNILKWRASLKCNLKPFSWNKKEADGKKFNKKCFFVVPFVWSLATRNSNGLTLPINFCTSIQNLKSWFFSREAELSLLQYQYGNLYYLCQREISQISYVLPVLYF